ncbi:MAG: hypothetical protein BWY65_02227 [Firmicutes bacterium ADurb.Bin373]|nr:MAG: hypothetical protein BWY65_02227 [Firmicutes bacterium ADurb.Bin373]
MTLYEMSRSIPGIRISTITPICLTTLLYYNEYNNYFSEWLFYDGLYRVYELQ